MPKNVAVHFWKLFLFSTPVANHECSQVSIMGIGKYHLNWTLLIACQCFYHSSAGKKSFWKWFQRHRSFFYSYFFIVIVLVL